MPESTEVIPEIATQLIHECESTTTFCTTGSAFFSTKTSFIVNIEEQQDLAHYRQLAGKGYDGVTVQIATVTSTVTEVTRSNNRSYSI